MKLSDMLFANAMMGEGGGGGGGSSDFSTAEIEVTITSIGQILKVATFFDVEGFSASASDIQESGTFTVILYKGHAVAGVQGGSFDTVSGDAEKIDSTTCIITGDCTITIS